jgi:four helix bundle protein
MSERIFDLEDRLLDFAARIIRVSESMKPTPAGRHVGDQLLRSGTSPFANHGEAEGAESLNDFVYKFRICYKELRESRRWMRLAQRADLLINRIGSRLFSMRLTNSFESLRPVCALQKKSVKKTYDLAFLIKS